MKAYLVLMIALLSFLVFVTPDSSYGLNVSAHMMVVEINNNYITVIDEDGEEYGYYSRELSKQLSIGDVVFCVLRFHKAEGDQMFKLNHMYIPVILDKYVIEVEAH